MLIKIRRFSDKSFTLVELLLAAVILAFVLTGLLALFISCIFLNETNRNTTIATSHAQFAMEEIKNTTFTSIAGATWNSATIQTKGLVPLNSETIVINVAGINLLDITVTVNWKDRGTRDRTMSLETLISEP